MTSSNYVQRREDGTLLAGSANQSPGEFAAGLSGASYQIDWSGFDALDATLTVECSNDRQKSGARYNLLSDDPSVVCRFTEASGTQIINIKKDKLKNEFLRLSFAPGANTQGSISYQFYGSSD